MDGYKIKTTRFLKHVKDSGGIVTLIAQRLGCERVSLIQWLNRNPSFWEYVYDERERIVDIAETKLFKKLNAEEDWAIKFVLGSTNRGRRRGYDKDIEVTQKPSSHIIINVPKEVQRLIEEEHARIQSDS